MNHASKYSKLLNDKRIPYMRPGLNLNQIKEQEPSLSYKTKDYPHHERHLSLANVK